MPQAKDLSGRRFGLLLVRERAADGRWLCDCDCGGQVTAPWQALVRGQVKRCSCAAEAARALPRKGYKGLGGLDVQKLQPERRNWQAMIRRCRKETDAAYKHYGGRGIKVCDEWRASFEAFYNHIGPMPGPGYTVDRIDVNGNYEPGNVRWATKAEQNQNKRSTARVQITTGEHTGKVCALSVAARLLGVRYYTARSRLERGEGLVKIENYQPGRSPELSSSSA